MNSSRLKVTKAFALQLPPVVIVPLRSKERKTGCREYEKMVSNFFSLVANLSSEPPRKQG